MQCWTPVLVIDPAHPRANTAGTAQGAPYTPGEAASSNVADLERAADAAVQYSERTAQALRDAEAAHMAAVAAADAAHAAAAQAAEEGANNPERSVPMVSVKFDADSEVVSVPLAALRALG